MQDEEEVTFKIAHDSFQTMWSITIESPSTIDIDELAACLRSLAKDIDEDPEIFNRKANNTDFECH